MNIDHVLSAHGVFKGGDKMNALSVTNLTSQPILDGTQVKVTWSNPTNMEFTKTEMFVSTTDLTNINYETCSANHTRVVNDKTTTTYNHSTTLGTTYYFKAFANHLSFNETVVAKGLTTFVTALDKTPPNPITNFSAATDDKIVNLSWTNPTNSDFSKVKILMKQGSYPTSPTDGTVAYEGSSTSTTVSELTNDVDYYFRAFTYDTSLNENNNTSMQLKATPAPVKIYGVRIDKANSNPETSVTYTDRAIGMTGGSSTWDSIYPFSEIKPCLLKDGVVSVYLNKSDFTKDVNGNAVDITSGNSGDVMIEFPKIYWKITSDTTQVNVKYASKQVDSTWKPLAHTKASVVKDKIYMGAYLGNTSSSKLRSLSGKSPTGSQTLGTFRTQAQNNGNGYQQIGYYQLLMLQILYLIRYKNLDSQTALGRGYVDGNSAAINTGGTNTKGMYYGETTGKLQMKFAGIEDFWGNCHCWIDGLYCDSSRNILIGNNSFSDTGSGYTNYGQSVTSDVAGFISDIQGATETGFIAKTATGSATTYYSDNFTLTAASLPVFGAHSNYGSSAGAFLFLINYPSDSTNSARTSRLCYV